MNFHALLLAALPATLVLLLLSAGIEDVRVREIADWKNAAIAALAPLWWWACGFGPADAAVQVALALAAFGLFALAFRLGMMGGGDVKLIAALALWFPYPQFAQLLVAMSLAGGLVTVALLVERAWRKRPIEVPYGVAIAIAGMIAAGEPVVNQIAP